MLADKLKQFGAVLFPFGFVSIVFFSLGAFFSIKGIDLIKFVKEHSLWSLLYIPLVILELLYVGHDNLVPYIHRIAVLFGSKISCSLSV